MSENIIWYIDEDEVELRTYRKRLSRLFSSVVSDNDELEVIGILARPTVLDYNDLLNDHRTVSIIIDQRLTDEGTTNYTGINLAEHLRSINKKIPIYILTAFDDDTDAFSGKEWSVEYVFSKKALTRKDQYSPIIQRVLRHTRLYHDIVEGDAKRYGELIRKSISEPLSEAERKELEKYRKERIAGIAEQEDEKADKLERLIAELNELNTQAQNEIDKLSNDKPE